MPENMMQAAKNLPSTPGCYWFKDKDNTILYIGKSKCLKDRVLSYFGKHKPEKFNRMMVFACFVEHQCTDTDIEALILEYKLIKEYRPPYNARMVKNRQHWFIKINKTIPYPGCTVVDKIDNDAQYLYVGPFFKSEHAQAAIETLAEYWPIPTCGTALNKKPCMRYHIKKCYGFCYHTASDTVFLKELIAFLQGDVSFTFETIAKLIADAAENMQYEKAAGLRDLKQSLHDLSKQLKNMPPDLNGKRYYVSVSSYFDGSCILAYMENACVKAFVCFQNGKKSKYINIVSQKEGEALAAAILEIDAIRYYEEV